MSVFLIVKQHPQLHADECGQALFQSYTGNKTKQKKIPSYKKIIPGRKKKI
jgi:hypothetical protein